MADFGLKISIPNFDALTGGDINMMFSSGWPSISVVREFTVDVAASDGFVPVATGDIAHEQDFPPMVFCWFTANSSTQNEGSGSLAIRQVPNITETYIKSLDSYNTVPIKAHFKIYNIDISTPKDYPYFQAPGLPSVYDPSFGIKIAKEGEDVDSEDLRDFIIHSRTGAPLVLAVITQESSKEASDDPTQFRVQYTNPAGYDPYTIGYGYTVLSGTPTWVYADTGSQAFPQLIYGANTSYVQYTEGSNLGASLVVLRDPIFSENVVEATY